MAARRRLSALDSRDLTVPRAHPSTSAVSASDSSSQYRQVMASPSRKPPVSRPLHLRTSP